MVGRGLLFCLNHGDGTVYEWDPGLGPYDISFLDIDRDGWHDILNSGPSWDGWPEVHLIHHHTRCQEAAP